MLDKTYLTFGISTLYAVQTFVLVSVDVENVSHWRTKIMILCAKIKGIALFLVVTAWISSGLVAVGSAFAATITASETNNAFTPNTTFDRSPDEYELIGNTVNFSSITKGFVTSENGVSEADQGFATQGGTIAAQSYQTGIGGTFGTWAETVTNMTSSTTTNQLNFATGAGFIAGSMQVNPEDGGFTFGASRLNVVGSRGFKYDMSVNGVSVWSAGIEFVVDEGNLLGTSGVDLRRSIFTVSQTGTDLSGTLSNDGWIQSAYPSPPSGPTVVVPYEYTFDSREFTVDLGSLAPGESLDVVYSVSLFSGIVKFVNDGPVTERYGTAGGKIGKVSNQSFFSDPTTGLNDSFAFVMSSGDSVSVPISASLPMFLIGLGAMLVIRVWSVRAC